jgi:putative PEP-CTERM system TPR-repeat lipoprotein
MTIKRIVFALVATLSFTGQGIYANENAEASQQIESSFVERFLSYFGANDESTEVSVQAPVDDVKKSNDLYLDALSRLDNNELNAAIIQLQNAIQFDPKNFSAYLLLAELYLKNHQFILVEYVYHDATRNGLDNKALISFLAKAYLQQFKYREIIENIPTTGLPRNLKLEMRVAKAKAYFGVGNYVESRKLVEEVLKTASSYVPANILLAKLSMIEGDVSYTKELLSSSADAGALLPDYWLLLAEVARKEGDNSAALKAYDEGIALEEDHLVLRQARAGLYLDEKNFAKAASDISYIREFYPSDLKGLMLQALMQLNTDDIEAKNETLKTAYGIIDGLDLLKLENDAYNLMLVSTLYYFGERNTEAERLLGRYLELKPNDINAYRLLGNVLIQLNRHQAAQSLLKKGLEKNPRSLPLLSLVAEADMKLQNFESASNTLEKMLSYLPESGELKQRLALAILAKGDTDRAISMFRQLIREDPSNYGVRMTLAKIYLGLGDFKSTIRLCNLLIAQDESNPVAYNILGNAYLQQDDMQNARKYFEDSLKIEQGYIPSIFNLAMVDISENNLNKAQEGLQRVLALDKENVLAYKQLATISKMRQDFKQEIVWLSRAYQKQPEVEVGLRLVKLYESNSQQFESQKTLKSLLQTFPESMAVHELEALQSIKDSNIEKAKRIYKRMALISAEKMAIQDLVEIAQSQREMGDEEGTQETLSAAYKLAPDNILVLLAKSDLELSLGNASSAFESALKIVEYAPNKAAGYLLAGESSMQLERNDEALRWYTDGLKNVPNDSSLALGKYKLIKQIEGLEQGVLFLEGWITKNTPKNIGPMQALAVAYAGLGQSTKAIGITEKLIHLYPNNAGLLNNLALLYLETGNVDALKYAEKAYELAPNSYAIMDTLGWVLTQQGNYDRGLSILRNAVAQSYNDPEVQYHYAVALSHSGNRQEAKRVLSQALMTGQRFNDIDDAKALLKRIK